MCLRSLNNLAAVRPLEPYLPLDSLLDTTAPSEESVSAYQAKPRILAMHGPAVPPLHRATDAGTPRRKITKQVAVLLPTVRQVWSFVIVI